MNLGEEGEPENESRRKKAVYGVILEESAEIGRRSLSRKRRLDWEGKQ